MFEFKNKFEISSVTQLFFIVLKRIVKTCFFINFRPCHNYIKNFWLTENIEKKSHRPIQKGTIKLKSLIII